MSAGLRVALFADCFHEVNGVANTMRHIERVAISRGLPLLMVRSGPAVAPVENGSVRAIELQRGGWTLPVDCDLDFDCLLARHLGRIEKELAAFDPAVIHVTGPGDIGILGVLAAHKLRVPLVASWHTNVHAFAARRLECLPFPFPLLSRQAEAAILSLMALYYRIPKLILAPNPELAALLARRTGRPVHPMARGIDAELFHPARNVRPGREIVFGYVGRLTPEKNVGLLPSIGHALRQAGAAFRMVVVGEGGERAALERAMPEARFTGVLKGEALADAYRGLDVLLFPSRTDTYGNVVLEALASGVPALVTSTGGPKFLVSEGRTGWIAKSDEDFVRIAVRIASNHSGLPAMGAACRTHALSRDWRRIVSDLCESWRLAAQTHQSGKPLLIDPPQVHHDQSVEAMAESGVDAATQDTSTQLEVLAEQHR